MEAGVYREELKRKEEEEINSLVTIKIILT